MRLRRINQQPDLSKSQLTRRQRATKFLRLRQNLKSIPQELDNSAQHNWQGDPVQKTIEPIVELSMGNKRQGWPPQHGCGQVRGWDRIGEHPDCERESLGPWMWASNQSCLMGFIPRKVSVRPRTAVCECSRWGAGQGAARGSVTLKWALGVSGDPRWQDRDPFML